jgi:hypothetical protein
LHKTAGIKSKCEEIEKMQFLKNRIIGFAAGVTVMEIEINFLWYPSE